MTDGAAQTLTLATRVEIGADLGFYSAVESGEQRLKLSVNTVLALFMLTAGGLILLLDVWLFKIGGARTMRWMPKVIQGILIAMPIIGLLFGFMLGRSYVFDASKDGQRVSGTGGPLIRWRWLWLFGTDVDARKVAAIRVRVKNNDQSNLTDRLRLHLTDAAGTDLLEIADEAADDKSIRVLLATALHLRDLLQKPLHVEGAANEAPDWAKDLIHAVRERATNT